MSQPDILASPEAETRAGTEPVPPEPPDLLLRMYTAMARTRACDERMWILTRQGRARFVVTGRGHEAAQAGSALALRAGYDYPYLYYRSMCTAIVLGVTPEDILRGVLAREGDPASGGRQLPNHFSSRRLRIPTVSSVVGGAITHAVGSAYAAKVRGADWVAVTYFGEGAAAKGDFHESLNFAAIHRLPVIFFCENNGWAISVPFNLEAPVSSEAERAGAYAIPGVHVDGLDPLATYRVMREAVERARSGGGPTLIEATCLRMVPHTSDDDDRYRSEEERAAVIKADPLPAFRKRLIAWGTAGEERLREIDAQIQAEVRAAEERALALPVATDALSHIVGGSAAKGTR